MDVISVTIPELGRTTRTNRDGAFAFGYGDRHDQAISAGRYELIFNPELQQRRLGSLSRWVGVQSGRHYRLGVSRLQLLDQSTPFVPIEGRSTVQLLAGVVKLDLSGADLQFPDSGRNGDLHLQFIDYAQLPYPVGGTQLPHWVYTRGLTLNEAGQPIYVEYNDNGAIGSEIGAAVGPYAHALVMGTA